ncbi:hypothetical protein P280DRAFT_495194 [Massarina eburnea CBS 473.64]|uniref:Uncharacterized protein n=1 Tax=Massarina eburnea CBS 473.64 TaxID=1395130 RepID=A0A6A6SBT6_9PLEO|nr:hypothetical protein P280DRAFT_495194 [Massarina eburnea CBS 473.64]
MTIIPRTVIYPLTPSSLLNHILTTQSNTSRTTLIICSSRETFLQGLLGSLQQQGTQQGTQLQDLMAPTLHNLATARHVKTSFCASVPALLAYMTAHRGEVESAHADESESRRVAAAGTETIVLVNALALHAPTPSFSAQGLSRTFAAAVEMATRVGAALVLAECQGRRGGETGETGGEGDVVVDGEVDPWEQDVSILNVSAKKFASKDSDRAWAGRTVKVKRIAARWFHFHRLPNSSNHG